MTTGHVSHSPDPRDIPLFQYPKARSITYHVYRRNRRTFVCDCDMHCLPMFPPPRGSVRIPRPVAFTLIRLGLAENHICPF